MLAVAFALHFRPWQGGLLEEWGFALTWQDRGFGALSDFVGATIGRPFHLVPAYIGLVISNGGFFGMYLVLGIISVGQVVAAAWALRPVLGGSIIPWIFGLIIAIHPWWAAGDVLRFMPAQFSCLLFVLWLGFSVRLLRGASGLWLIGVVATPVVSLLSYQALALVYLLAMVALVAAMTVSPVRRIVDYVVATVAAVALATVYSIFLAPRLFDAPYEASLMSGSHDLVGSIHIVAHTARVYGKVGLVAMAIAAFALIVIAVVRRVGWVRIALLTLVGPVGLLSALSYAATTLHLNDPERVMFPIGTAAWLTGFAALLLYSAAPPEERRRAALATVALAAAVSIAFAALNLEQWARFSGLQQQTLALLEPIVADTPADSTLVVVDQSGLLGDVYTFYPPHLQYASRVTFDNNPTPVELCTDDSTPRRHDIAARYPLTTTQSCSAVLSPDARLVAVGIIGDGAAKVYEQPTAVVVAK